MKAQTSQEGTRLVGSRTQAEGLALDYSGSGAARMDNHGLLGLVREETRGQLSWLLFSLGMMSQGQPRGWGTLGKD